MTESGRQRSGITVTPAGGGEEKVMVGARGMGGDVGGEVFGKSVGEAEEVFGMSVGEAHEMEDGGSFVHICTSLINSHSVSSLVNENRMNRPRILLSDIV